MKYAGTDLPSQRKLAKDMLNMGPELRLTEILMQRAAYRRDRYHCPSCGAYLTAGNRIVDTGYAPLRCAQCADRVEGDTLLGADVAAAILGLSRSSIYKAAARGKLHAIHTGRMVQFRAREVLAWRRSVA